MTTFNKSNWTRTTSSEHSRVYAPSAITAGNVTGNGGATVVTVTVPFQFQGNSQVEATLPVTGAVLNSGLSLGTVVLLAPASGSYAAGNHPRVQVPVINSTNGNLNVQTTQGDLIIIQY